ncbi:hypothetical protein C8R43DRAFT_960525 [Mycena crocata]|nr:hypothetical protein C8R43DRAFT_960525 [Mycena crocata]
MFQVYGLTEHVPRYRTEDLYPEEENLTLGELAKQFEDFLAEAHRLKLKYSAEICLLVGLETDYITALDLDELQEILQKHHGSVEYIVGSVHHKAVQSIDSAERRTKDGGFLSAYFDAQYELLQRFRLEVIGHLDLCRLYTPTLKISEYPEAWERVQRNILYAIGYGVMFEINASALRKGWDTPYPGQDVLEMIVTVPMPLASTTDGFRNIYDAQVSLTYGSWSIQKRQTPVGGTFGLLKWIRIGRLILFGHNSPERKYFPRQRRSVLLSSLSLLEHLSNKQLFSLSHEDQAKRVPLDAGLLLPPLSVPEVAFLYQGSPFARAVSKSN